MVADVEGVLPTRFRGLEEVEESRVLVAPVVHRSFSMFRNDHVTVHLSSCALCGLVHTAQQEDPSAHMLS